MNVIQEILQLVAGMQWSDYLDIIIVAFLIYKIFPMIRSTGTSRVAKVVIMVIVVAWLTGILNLYTMQYIFDQFLQVGLIAVIILFQPELRRMLEHLSNVKLKKLFGAEKPEQEMAPVISHTVMACEVMSRERVGALVVFARDNRLEEYFKTGTMIDGQVSEQLLRNIFFKNSPLHDGAVIIRDGRVTAAGCVLPLSTNPNLSRDLGTRHHAAVGMSEASDAVVVVVSEETGTISVAVGGMLKRHLAPQTLERLLCNELCPEDDKQTENLVVLLRQKLQKKGKDEQE